MRIVTQSEIGTKPYWFYRELKRCIFIYPTDTIYGIGCNAFDAHLVEKIRELKEQHEHPWSVIAPSKEWIHEYCVVDKQEEQWLEKLPGPYTLILRMKRPEEFPKSVSIGRKTLGVRIPDHWISGVVATLGIPIITTSANKSGRNIMRDPDDIPSSWKDAVKFVFYEGEPKGKPSTLVDLTHPEVDITER